MLLMRRARARDIIDGRHRFAVDEDWSKIRPKNIETEEQKLVARLVTNVCRRHISAQEETDLFARAENLDKYT